MLREFTKKKNSYIGIVAFEDDAVEQYNRVSFVNRTTQECLFYDLIPVESGAQFEINGNEDMWSAGVWDAYIEPKDTDSARIPIEMEASNDGVKKGIFSSEMIHFVDNKKVYIPLISKEGKLIFKVGGRKNNKIAYDVIEVKDYELIHDRIELKGIGWPAVTSQETYFVVESSDGSVRKRMPIQVETTVQILLEDVKKLINEVDVYKRWNIWIEMNLGSKLVRSSLKVAEDAKKYENYLFDERNPISENGVMLHSKLERELRIAYDKTTELVKRFSFGLLTDFDMRKGKMQIAGRIFCLESQLLGLRLIQRDSNEESSYQFSLCDGGVKEGYSYFSAEIDLNELKLSPIFWDLYVVCMFDGQEELFRVKNESKQVFLNMNKKLIRYHYIPDSEYVAFPYLTNFDNFSIMYREKSEYDSVYYKWKESLAVWIYQRLRRFFKEKECWLICEKYAETAQDNGYYFFDYCYKNHKEKKVYYIINKKSVDYKRVKHMKKRVIPFMSLKHMVYMQAPVIMVSSEARLHYYAWRVARGRIQEAYKKNPFVFLQHGVIGLKKVDLLFRKSFLAADLFVTSSDFEKGIIVDNYGYDEEEVMVTGLARWDVLQNKVNPSGPREVILMPTWRTWLEAMRDGEFIETEYYKTYAALIEDKRLDNLAKEHNMVINFIIHPKLKQYITNFSSIQDHIHVYQFDEVPINELLMRASMLVTDYSSVAWEMYYCKKPVVFFRFDIEQYEEKQGAYMDLKSETVGEVTDQVPRLLEILADYAESDFAEKEKFAADRSQYFKYIDKNNSKRIYDEIEKKFGV